MNNTIETDFIQAIKEAGLEPPGKIVVDGRIHRFSSDGRPREKAGWYVLHDLPDGVIAGAFGCWRSIDKVKWSSVTEAKLDKQQQRRIKDAIKKSYLLSEQERITLQEKIAKDAESLWEKAKPADPAHLYLVKKNVKAHDLRQNQRDGKDILLVPLRDLDGKLWSLQRIYPDGNKLFLKDGRSSGMMHTLGEPTPTRVIAEGFSTGASIHEATGHAVHIAFNCHNLKTVAESIRKAHPDTDLVIAADDDWKTEGNPGLTKATEAARSCGAKLAIPTWPEDQRGEKDTDFNDLALSQGPAHVKTCIEQAAKPRQEEGTDKKKTKDGSKQEGEKTSQASALVLLAKTICELFIDQNDEPHASIPVQDHREVYRIDSKFFRNWLCGQYYETSLQVANDPALRSAISTLIGIATFRGEKRQVLLRVGEQDDKIFLDLADENWRSCEVTKTGWSVIDCSPVTFCRTSSMRSLPEPRQPADINRLWRHVNVAQEDQLLLKAWMIEIFRRNSPDVVLELVGEQGSGKSFTHNNIIQLIDPNRVNLRSAPQKVDDLLVPASSTFCVNLENVSRLSPAMQDRLCSLSTGGGFATRTLYTNQEVTALDLQRPVIINGITGPVTHADLLDRTLSLELPRLEEVRPPSAMKEAFEADRPHILAGILDLLSKVMVRLPGVNIHPKRLPRMADFALCGEAVYIASGRKSGEFLRDYAENRRRGIRRTLDAHPVGMALISFMESYHIDYFEGTVKQLLSELEPHKPDGEKWIGSPKGLADGLRRLSPALRSVGIEVRMDTRPKRDGYHVLVRKIDLDEDHVEKPEREHCEHREQESETNNETEEVF